MRHHSLPTSLTAGTDESAPSPDGPHTAPARRPDFGRTWLAEWALDPDVIYLNHGTVGAPPRRALAVQQAIRDEIERQPARFLLRELCDWLGNAELREGTAGPLRLRAAAQAVAEYLGAREPDLVFVDNASTGVNAVLRSLELHPGDELLLHDHAYGAVAQAAQFVARQHGARVRTLEVPYPPFDPGAWLQALAAALNERTRLALVDHISSDSALLFPVAEAAALCRQRGVPLLVDGAHVPGAVTLDLSALGVDWYTGNLHKWAYAPRSCAFLWAAPERQAPLHPTVVSWGLDRGFVAEFDWVGTHDPSPYLAMPAVLAWRRELGEQAILRYNHALAWNAARHLTTLWETPLEVAEEHVGCMVALALPTSLGSSPEDALRCRNALLYEHGIEIHTSARRGRLYARLGAQIYNDESDIEKLGAAVLALARGRP